ncbi:MAG: serine protease [Rhodospirillales bacterium]|nr:serine protease [Rhodospirillales bacterium]
MHAWLRCRGFGKAVRRGGFAGAVVLAVVLWGADNARAADTNAEDNVLQAVVGISAFIPEGARTAEHLGMLRSGTGVVIDGDGLVLTIGYLMMEAERAAVTNAEGNLVPAIPIAYDHGTGFGLLRATQPLGLKPVELGNSADLAEGAPVIIVSKGGPVPVMAARVSSRREFAGYWEYLLDRAIFTVPAYSQYGGAALIGADGRLVGIGSLAVNDAVSDNTPAPGNMFVPIDVLKPILGDLVRKGRSTAPAHPWLGVYTNENNGRVFVARVAADGPAQNAGIKPGDIIMGVGGKRVKSMADFYRKVWARGSAGAEIPVDVLPIGAASLDIQTISVKSRDRLDWLKLNKGL